MKTRHKTCLIRSLASLMSMAAASLLSHNANTQPAIVVDQSTYDPGQDITVSYSGGPGNAADWVGIYPAGVTPGDEDSTRWSYVGGPDYTQGSVVFEGGLAAQGDWVAYLLENDGYNVLASVTFQVTGPSITTDQDRYAPGDSIVVTYSGGPGNAADWVGIYPAGVTPGDEDSTLWSYGPGPDYHQGSVTFDTGLTEPGDWVVYLLENDGYTVLASAAFVVFDPGTLPVVYSLHYAYVPEETIEIGWRNGPGNALDWIGLYPDGIVPGSVGSTRWLYVDGTQGGSIGLQEGTVQFEGGLGTAGPYDVHLLENDGYTSLANADFTVVEVFDPLLRSDKRFYGPGEAMSFSFSNGWGSPKDWIGLYPAGVTPGDEDSLAWIYVDGTQQGTASLIEGTVAIVDGLSEPGDYDAHLLSDDGYYSLAMERITVLPESGPRVIQIRPANGTQAADPRPTFSAIVVNGVSGLVLDTVQLTLDGTEVAAEIRGLDDESHEIVFGEDGLFAPGSSHEYVLTFDDDADPAQSYSVTSTFTVTDYRNIVLPAPIVFEDFNAVPEGSLPAGWTQKSYTEITNGDEDLTNLDSATYGRWTAVDENRFRGPLTPYSDFGNEMTDYWRVLSENPLNVLNGEVVSTLVQGRILFGNSGYRNGLSQVLYLYSPDFDLTGQTDVNLCFYSIWEQNQDSIGAVEYSIDSGQTWLPIVYMLDGPDVLTMENPQGGDPIVDAVGTFTTEHGDVARYVGDDLVEVGSSYGTFIGAAISQDLAPHISARVDNDAVGSKRIELFRLPDADGRATVRFRFAHAGTDSWYFGIDNFGLYSIAPVVGQPTIAISKTANEVTVSWPADSGAVTLEQASSLTNPVWTAVEGVEGNSITLPAEGDAMFYRLSR